jgi:hypothetical protein
MDAGHGFRALKNAWNMESGHGLRVWVEGMG